MMMRTQIILAGIGGQGVLFASRIFSEMGLKLGLNVLGSETHGMSQRGGSVIAHLKLGDFHSPLIRAGAADILYSFAEEEAYRTLKFLRGGGLCFVNTEDPRCINSTVKAHLESKGISFRAFDAGGTAAKIGFTKAANIVLIGYSVGTGLVPFGHDIIKSVLEEVSPPETRGPNKKAFDIGMHLGSNA